MTPSLQALDEIVVLDHFAGTGWGVACRWLGLREYGVEIMREAIRTRSRVGFRTVYRDVWAGLFHPWLVPFHSLYIASPPCQTFSVAGRGDGRRALEQVLRLIDTWAWKDPATLKAAGAELGDDRTALVLTPLAHIWAHRPKLIALEQVPTVLPVWEAMAEVLRGLGYSVWTGNLQAEQYGVPQTRKRAILMARLDSPVTPPVPTHSRYYSREPKRLDLGVQKWVSMAEALGWGEPGRSVLRSNYGTGGDASKRGERLSTEPAPTITSKADRNKWDGVRKMTADEAATLQSYPAWGHAAGYASVKTAGTRPRPVSEPAATVTVSATFAFEDASGDRRAAVPEELAVLQSYPPIMMRPELERWRWIEAPATTVAGDPRITAREHHFHGEQALTALKLRPDEAARFQSFPTPFPFQGGRGKQFLQIGNAVPPLLARAIIAALITPPTTSPKETSQMTEWDQVFAEVAA